MWSRKYAALAAVEIQEDSVIMLGDSITEGGKWQELFPDHTLHNQGISGDDTFGVLRRVDLVTRSRPRKVFVMIGTNDIGKGTAVADIIANVDELTAQISRDSPSTEIHLQSVLPRRHTRREQVAAVNAGIEQIARERQVKWVDLRELFDRGDGALDLAISPDALHLTAAGYRRWADAIAPLIEASDPTDDR